MSLILSEVTAQPCRLDRSAQSRPELDYAGWGCEAEALSLASQGRQLPLPLPGGIYLLFSVKGNFSPERAALTLKELKVNPLDGML